VCVLGLLIGVAGDKGLCSESNLSTQALVGSTEQARKITRDDSFLVSEVDKETLVEQKQVTERGPEQIDTQRLDAPQSKAAQSAPARERKQVLERDQEWGKAEALARALTSSLRGEVAAVRSAAEAERIKQKETLDRERDRANALAREFDLLRAELDRARRVGQEAAQASEAEVKQREALEQERGRADTLEREVASLRAELEAARKLVTQATSGSKQKQALETGLKQERDRAAALASELTSLRAELDQTRAASWAAARAAEAMKTEQQKERANTETLARELDSARKQAEERSALLAAAHAEVLQVKETNSANATEQKLALAGERDRADALGRELASVRNQLEAGNKQIATLNALLAQHSGKTVADSSQARIAEFSSTTIEEEEHSKEQISGGAAALTSAGSSAAESARPQAQAPSPPPASDLGRSPSARAVIHSPVDEQRLLARANALLQQADISGARPLLEHAVEHGSARAAFMLAETYDARVLQAWRARGISGDPTKARQLYERAQAGGIEDAKGRIEALQ
jgi:myosin heavy subunit